MKRCCVGGCSNTYSSGVSFHKFPKNEELCKKMDSGGAENEGCGKEQKLDSWPRNLRVFSTLWGVLLRSVCEAAGGGVRLAKQEKAIADWQRIRLTSFQLKSSKEIIVKIESIEMHFLWCFKKLSFAWILGRHLCWSCDYGIMMGDNILLVNFSNVLDLHDYWPVFKNSLINSFG